MQEKWVKAAGYHVCINEHNQVIRALKETSNNTLPAMPYRYDRKTQTWVNARGVKLSTLRSGIHKGTYSIK